MESRTHHFRITVEAIPHPGEEPAPGAPTLRFETSNHDDIIAIAQRLSERGLVSDQETPSLAIGLKLFGEVLLHHRKEPLFAELAEAFGGFMRRLKSRPDPS